MAMTASVPSFHTPACARRLKEAGGGEAVATRADAVRLEAKSETGLTGLKADALKAAIAVALAKPLPQAAP